MHRHYKEKALLATTHKIKNLERDAGFFRRNVYKVILFGILFSLWAPTYSDSYGKTIMQRLELPFWQAVGVVGIVYLIFCLLGHVVWTFQERNEMKRLLKRKAALEAALKE